MIGLQIEVLYNPHGGFYAEARDELEGTVYKTGVYFDQDTVRKAVMKWIDGQSEYFLKD